MRRPQGAFSLPGTLVLQELPRSTSCNVHGVRAEFLALGRHAAEPEHEFSEGAYFIGKLLWAKGHGLLIDYLAGEEGVRVDLYGNGEDSEKVQAKAAEAAVDLRFFSGRDHSDESLHAYKVFVNPSQTEVLSTTTAEALAMGNLVGGTSGPRRAGELPCYLSAARVARVESTLAQAAGHVAGHVAARGVAVARHCSAAVSI